MTESTTPPLSGKLLAVARYAQEAVTVGESRSRLEEFQRIATPAAVEQALTSTLEENEGLAAGQYRLRDMLIAAEAKALTMERALEGAAHEILVMETAALQGRTNDQWERAHRSGLRAARFVLEAQIAALRPIGDQSVSDGKELGLSRIGGETDAASVASDLTGQERGRKVVEELRRHAAGCRERGQFGNADAWNERADIVESLLSGGGL